MVLEDGGEIKCKDHLWRIQYQLSDCFTAVLKNSYFPHTKMP